MIKRWLYLRHLSRAQVKHWDEAQYINTLYSMLNTVRFAKRELARITQNIS
jgi:hypothetical protein